MIDRDLRTNNEQELIDALPFARGFDENGVAIWLTASHDYELNIIGALDKGDGTTQVVNGEIVELTPPTLLPGFHADIRCTQAIADLIPSEIIIIPPPNDKKRGWAGG